MANEPEMLAFKAEVKEACIAILTERIHTATAAMDLAQESANSEEKSSVGDKHETSRAKSQADRNMNARQLAQARKDLDFIRTLNVNQLLPAISTGSLFELGAQWFFVALGLGAITVNNTKVMVISHQSPLFLRLKMKAAGEQVLFADRDQLIKNVF